MGNEDTPGGGPSLKARAIAYLSRREHSRLELRRKLAAHCDDPDRIEAVLDEIQRQHWQSDQRYAESYAQRQAPRQGAARILQSLRRQGVDEESLRALADRLTDTEAGRAREVWQRKFGQAPADARDYARQYRFLAGRGFSADCVRRILGGRDIED
ncbi:recombination regulator RecX [Castellaniella sp. S9]|uniref:recombination regulator RecX n=1 Tax=Castellaniella sp. S9 TaxID=2993652 RepID=UPI0022B36E8A|nr:recombination regulator RecX [Castellaniella sp. S9]